MVLGEPAYLPDISPLVTTENSKSCFHGHVLKLDLWGSPICPYRANLDLFKLINIFVTQLDILFKTTLFNFFLPLFSFILS